MKDNLTRRDALGVVGTAGLAVLAATALLASKAPAAERHPHIHTAIDELRAARDELKSADHDFKGHRADAIEAIDHALEQLRKCLEVE